MRRSRQSLAPRTRVCPSCDGLAVGRDEVERFAYGTGEATVELSCPVVVYECGDCEIQFTDEEAEVARHDAVCRHLRRMTASQICRLRGRLGLSQSALARLAGVGRASLVRWETGRQVQSASLDNLLRLLGYPENVARLEAPPAAPTTGSR